MGSSFRAGWQRQHVHETDKHEPPAEAAIAQRFQNITESASMRLLASADLCETSKGAAPSFLHLTAIGQLGDGF